MDEETRHVVKEILELERENQIVLKKLLNYQRWTRIWSFLKLAVVVGSLAGVYYFFQPVLERAGDIYQGFFNALDLLSGQEMQFDRSQIETAPKP